MKSLGHLHLLGLAIDAVGVPYPDATHEICLAADAVLFVRWDIKRPKHTNFLVT
jgi:hypothetical protein